MRDTYKKVKNGEMKKGELNETLIKIYNYIEKHEGISLRDATEAVTTK